MPRLVIKWTVLAILRPRSTMRSHRGSGGMFFARHSARSQATFSFGVSPGGPADLPTCSP